MRERILRVKFPKLVNDKGQLVDIIDSKMSEKNAPADARFLSDKNRTVEKETQARFTGPNPTSAVGQAGTVKRKLGSGKLRLEVPGSILEGQSGAPAPQISSLAPSNYLPEITIEELEGFDA